MALRGKPTQPFYMVGRMDGQSVVLRAEKGKLKLLVNGAEGDQAKEVVYSLEKGDGNGKDPEAQAGTGQEVLSIGEMQGGTVDMDGAAQTLGDMQGTLSKLDGVELVAEPCPGGDDAGVGTEDSAGPGAGVECPPSEPAGETDAIDTDAADSSGNAAGAAAEEEPAGEETSDIQPEGNEGVTDDTEGQTGPGTPASIADLQSSQRGDDSGTGGEDTGDIPQELLRVGTQGSGSVVNSVGE